MDNTNERTHIYANCDLRERTTHAVEVINDMQEVHFVDLHNSIKGGKTSHHIRGLRNVNKALIMIPF